jgi:hypothetical protein
MHNIQVAFARGTSKRITASAADLKKTVFFLAFFSILP